MVTHYREHDAALSAAATCHLSRVLSHGSAQDSVSSVQCPQTRRVQEASQFISNVISPADRRHNYTAPSHGQLIINFCFNCFTSALPPPGPGDSRRRVIGIKFLRGAAAGLAAGLAAGASRNATNVAWRLPQLYSLTWKLEISSTVSRQSYSLYYIGICQIHSSFYLRF